jgi:hypothetical protein
MAIRVAVPSPLLESKHLSTRSFGLRTLPTYLTHLSRERRAKQVLDRRCESLRMERLAALHLTGFSEDFWRLSEMIADASRDGEVTPAFERDYQILRLSYNQKWSILRRCLPESEDFALFETMVAAPTLTQAILGSFWEHYERMQRAEIVLDTWREHLNK